MTLRSLLVNRSTLRSIIDHARESHPAESVGLLGGSLSGEVLAVHPLSNIGPPGTFLADPFEQWTALQDFKRTEQILLAIYHSHPDGGARLSPTDILFAQNIDAICVVIAIGDDATLPTRVAAYSVQSATPTPVPIRIVD